jgi:hypothetical protein
LPGYSDPAPDRKTNLPDTCPCTPITRVFIFSIFYQAGEGINSMCSVKSYYHTALILHRLTSYILLYSLFQFIVLLVCLCREVICSFPFITYTVDISIVTEPLPSYQQFLIVGFCGYESCTRCLATASLKHTYFLRYFGPLGRMPHFSLLIRFLIQSGKRGK